jgi:hypothetical protein
MVGFEMKGKAAADKARASGDQNAFWKGSLHSSGMASMSFRRLAGVAAPAPKNQRRRLLSMPTTLKPLRANRWTLSEPIQPAAPVIITVFIRQAAAH